MKHRTIVIFALLLLLMSTAIANATYRVAVLNFEPEERASRTTAGQIMHARRGDFINVMKDYPQFELISQNTVTKSLDKLGISEVRYLTAQLAGDIGRELEADILIWGTISEVSATEVRMVANVMVVRSQNINQLRFNLRKRSADRISGIKREIVDKLDDFADAEIRKLFDIGEQQLNAQNYAAARTTFNRITEIEPKNVDAWYYLGYIAYLQRDFDASVSYCETGLDVAPQDERILNNFAEASLQTGQYDCALDALKKLAELTPGEEILVRIANVYFQTNAIYDAIEVLKEVLELNPDSEVAHYRLGTTLFDNNEVEESIPHLEFIAEKYPEEDLINRKLTAAYMRTGKLEQAIRNYRNQIERNPQNVTAHLNLAGALRTKEQNREALEVLKKLEAFDKDNPTVYIRLSDVNIALNNLNEAERNANRAKTLNENLYEPYTLLAQIFQLRGYLRYEAFINLEEKAKSAFGQEANRLIEQRNTARSEAHEIFRNAHTNLNTAISKTNEPAIIRDINSRKQLLDQLINETRPTFFD